MNKLYFIFVIIGIVMLGLIGSAHAEPTQQDVVNYIDRTITFTLPTIKTTQFLDYSLDSMDDGNWSRNTTDSVPNGFVSYAFIRNQTVVGQEINMNGYTSIYKVLIQNIRYQDDGSNTIGTLNVSLYETNSTGGIIGVPLTTTQINKGWWTLVNTYQNIEVPLYYRGLDINKNYSIVLLDSEGNNNATNEYEWAFYNAVVNYASFNRTSSAVGVNGLVKTSNDNAIRVYYDGSWADETGLGTGGGMALESNDIKEGTGAINVTYVWTSSSGGTRDLIKDYRSKQDWNGNYNFSGIQMWIKGDGTENTVGISIFRTDDTILQYENLSDDRRISIRLNFTDWKEFYFDFSQFPHTNESLLTNISKLRFRFSQSSAYGAYGRNGSILIDDIRLVDKRRGAFNYANLTTPNIMNQQISSYAPMWNYNTGSEGNLDNNNLMSSYAFAYTNPNSFYYHNETIGQILKDSIDLTVWLQTRQRTSQATSGTWIQGQQTSVISGYWLAIGRVGASLTETYRYLNNGDINGSNLLNENVSIYGTNKSRGVHLKDALNLSAQWGRAFQFPNSNQVDTLVGTNVYNQYLAEMIGLWHYYQILNDSSILTDFYNKTSNIALNQQAFGNFPEKSDNTSIEPYLDGYIQDQVGYVTLLYKLTGNETWGNMLYKFQNAFVNLINQSDGQWRVDNPTRNRAGGNFGFPVIVPFVLNNLSLNSSFDYFKQATYDDFYFSGIGTQGSQFTNYTLFNSYYNYYRNGHYLPLMYEYLSIPKDKGIKFPREYQHYSYNLFNGTNNVFISVQVNYNESNYFRGLNKYPSIYYAWDDDGSYWALGNNNGVFNITNYDSINNLVQPLMVTSALLTNGTSICNGSSSNLALNTGNLNITLNPNDYCYVLDNYNLIEGISRQYSPLWFSSSTPTTKHIASNLSESVNVDVIASLGDCSTKNLLTYTTDSGVTTTWKGTEARKACNLLESTGLTLTIEPAQNSNILTWEDGTTNLSGMILQALIVILGLGLMILALGIFYIYAKDNFGQIEPLQFIKACIVFIIVEVLIIALMEYTASIL